MKFGSLSLKIHGKPKNPETNPETPAKTEGKKRKPKKYVEDIRSVADIFKELKAEKAKERFAVLCVGNDMKGDDGVGFYAGDLLSRELGKDADFMVLRTSVPENHVREIRDFVPTLLIIIDCADFGKRPGSIRVIKEYQISDTFISTHTTPLTLFLRLYQADEPVRKAVILIGIQKKSNEFGQPMSAPVKKAGKRVADTIITLYGDGLLGISLEKEIAYLSNPIRNFLRFFRRKK